MQDDTVISPERGVLKRLADIGSGYVLIGCMLFMGLFSMGVTLQLVKVEPSHLVDMGR
jgi:hypothetical protein